jgi:hypothetical protein
MGAESYASPADAPEAGDDVYDIRSKSKNCFGWDSL